MSTPIKGSSPINVKRMVMWKLTSDDSTGTVYDATAHKFENQLNSFRYTPRIQTAEQYGDGVKVEDYAAKDGGDIESVIRAFSSDDEQFLFGETATTNGTVMSGSDDIVPYVAVAVMTERADGLVNLYKFPKVKWTPQGEDNKQREGTTVSYGTAALKGIYSPLLSNHKDCYKKRGLDPKEDKDFIENWFTEAAFNDDAAVTP
ncbi:MAG: hypothetical protein E7478_03835 [Ruminococcaceae bacterium]|nr:hypothetical protein [Oscillospiraceae bacterium]